jgi:plasmid stability protein
MATLYVRNFPDDLSERIRTLAARRRRSVSQEVVVLIDEAVKRELSLDDRAEALQRIAARRRKQVVRPGVVDTLTLLREDRNR